MVAWPLLWFNFHWPFQGVFLHVFLLSIMLLVFGCLHVLWCLFVGLSLTVGIFSLSLSLPPFHFYPLPTFSLVQPLSPFPFDALMGLFLFLLFHITCPAPFALVSTPGTCLCSVKNILNVLPPSVGFVILTVFPGATRGFRDSLFIYFRFPFRTWIP
jgi:hypothetical protein